MQARNANTVTLALCDTDITTAINLKCRLHKNITLISLASHFDVRDKQWFQMSGVRGFQLYNIYLIVYSYIRLKGRRDRQNHSFSMTKQGRNAQLVHADGFVQERRNSIANALESRLSCTDPSMYLLLFHRSQFAVFISRDIDVMLWHVWT